MTSRVCLFVCFLSLFVEGIEDSARHLYSCGGEGQILEHRPGCFLEDAVDVNALIGKTNSMKVKYSWNYEEKLFFHW